MIVLKEGHLTEKSDDRVEHLNTILAQMGRNLNDPTNLQKFRCPGFALGGGEMLGCSVSKNYTEHSISCSFFSKLRNQI